MMKILKSLLSQNQVAICLKITFFHILNLTINKIYFRIILENLNPDLHLQLPNHFRNNYQKMSKFKLMNYFKNINLKIIAIATIIIILFPILYQIFKIFYHH